MGNIVVNTEPEADFSEAQGQLESLLSSRQSLVLATHDAHDACELGVAPFVWENGSFAVLLSRLAAHTQHLERQPRLKVMLLQDEAEVRQPFARQRLSLSCAAERLERTDARSDVVFELMQQRFGSIVPLLRGLADFRVFMLTPKEGRFVAGFGKAYRLDALRVVEHLRG